uniref:WD repeat-containing protein 76 n=1 Tax=Esox lucius TaxID=8010 RepID=A0AAY5KF95_ESOLU
MCDPVYRSNLKDMELSEFGGAAKVMNDSIFSAAFHPCTSRLLMAAGDNSGEVGLWIPDSDMGDNDVLLFEPHTKPVVCMAFSRSHPTDLLTLSCDGTLRSTNVKKAVFDEVPMPCVMLSMNDEMSQAVHRGSSEQVGYGNLCDGHLTNQFVSATRINVGFFSSVVSIYDVRCMKESSNKPVSQLLGHSDSISGAYFSPGTGNRVLTSCLDDSIRIYDTSEITHKAPLLTRIKHGMETQPWMSDLAAVWDPKKEDCFVGGQHTAASQNVFHEGGQLQHSFQHPKMTKVLSVTLFHPHRNALLGCNARGKMYVFTD